MSMANEVKESSKMFELEGGIDFEEEKIVADKRKAYVPIYRKVLLTLEEAAAYTGLGQQKLRILTNSENSELVVWNGSKRMLKRRKLDAYLDAAYSV